MTDMPETELVRLAQAGDTDAFADLVRLHQRRAVSVAYRLLGNGEDARDVSQDAFVRAFRCLSQLEDPSRFSSWLLRTVSNLALNYRRARKRRAAVSLDDEGASAEQGRNPSSGRLLEGKPDDGGGPLPAKLHAAIGRALEQLPGKQRLALVLFSVEGLPQREVAEILECSVELVKWNVFQARRKLKELLSEFLDDQ